MTKQIINIGNTANDKKGDSLRAAFQKVNANFSELYTALGLAADVNLNLGNFVFTNNTLSLTNSNGDDSTATQIEIAQPVRVESSLTVGGDILPNGNLTSTIGSPTNKFHSIYVGTGSVYLGDARLSLEGGRISSSVGFDLTDSVGVVNGTVGWADVTGKPSILTGDDVIGFTTSDTISEETPGGTVSQTTSYQNQIIVDTTDAIRIANILTQTVDDTVTVSTDSVGSTIDVDGTGVYIKRYVEPEGPNNSSYFQFSTTNSGAIIEGVNENLSGNTSGRVTVSQGVIEITAAAEGISKSWTFDYEGTMVAPGRIQLGTDASIYGLGDFIGLMPANTSSAGLEIDGTNDAILAAMRDVTIRANAGSPWKNWTFNAQGDLELPAKFPVQFTAVFDEAHYNGGGTFQGDGTASIGVQLQGLGAQFQWLVDDPTFETDLGYVGQQAFRYTEADHGITGVNVDILMEMMGSGPYSLQIAFSPAPGPADLAKIRSTDELIVSSGTKGWIFDVNGDIYLPAGGDIRDSTGTSVLGGAGADLGLLKISASTIGTRNDPDSGGWGDYSLYLDPGGESSGYIQIPSVTGQQSGGELVIANNAVNNGGIRLSVNTGNYIFADTGLEVPYNLPIRQNNSWTKVTTPLVNIGAGTVVWTSEVNYISSAKLIIQVECSETGDSTGWHSQACEAIIASRGFAGSGPTGDPQMTVYGVIHTSTVPLVTFTVRRNPTTLMVEVVGTLTAAAGGSADLRIHSVEMSTRD